MLHFNGSTRNIHLAVLTSLNFLAPRALDKGTWTDQLKQLFLLLVYTASLWVLPAGKVLVFYARDIYFPLLARVFRAKVINIP